MASSLLSEEVMLHIDARGPAITHDLNTTVCSSSLATTRLPSIPFQTFRCILKLTKSAAVNAHFDSLLTLQRTLTAMLIGYFTMIAAPDTLTAAPIEAR